MDELHQKNPLDRFTGLADRYARSRPSYPDAAMNHVMSCADLEQGAVVVDVGSGTGIASRLFARHGLRVIGIEPNADMRDRAATESLPPIATQPIYRDGRAEATGLANTMADLVVATQAFHWFDSTAALAEFHRILKPNAWVALIWNERDGADPFSFGFSVLVRVAAEAMRIEAQRTQSGQALLTDPGFTLGHRIEFRHTQVFDEEGIICRAASSSHAPREATAFAALETQLRNLFAQWQNSGSVALRYITSVTMARRRE